MTQSDSLSGPIQVSDDDPGTDGDDESEDLDHKPRKSYITLKSRKLFTSVGENTALRSPGCNLLELKFMNSHDV